MRWEAVVGGGVLLVRQPFCDWFQTRTLPKGNHPVRERIENMYTIATEYFSTWTLHLTNGKLATYVPSTLTNYKLGKDVTCTLTHRKLGTDVACTLTHRKLGTDVPCTLTNGKHGTNVQ
jgi:hypothetical protein